jgi:hypothetical protein
LNDFISDAHKMYFLQVFFISCVKRTDKTDLLCELIYHPVQTFVVLPHINVYLKIQISKIALLLRSDLMKFRKTVICVRSNHDRNTYYRLNGLFRLFVRFF